MIAQSTGYVYKYDNLDNYYSSARGEQETGEAMEENNYNEAAEIPRVLPLEGGRNFRDLGGLQSRDGRTVRWRKLFRSGSLIALTERDFAQLAPHCIETVVDLRSNSERNAEPTKWKAGPVNYVAIEYEQSGDMLAFEAKIRAEGAKARDAKTAIGAFYRSMPDTFAAHFRTMFDVLAQKDAALLFHCSAGKDRTGVAAALLLSALDVPRGTIIEDFAMTDSVVDYLAAHASGKYELIVPNSPQRFLRDLPLDLVAPLFRSDPDYLAGTFEHIEDKYGSVRGYLRNQLDVDDAKLAAIKQHFLES